MASKATSDLGGGCAGDAKELPPAVAGACFFYFAVHVGCHSPLALHCMPCSGTEDAVSSPGSFLLSVVAFSANPCAVVGTAGVALLRGDWGRALARWGRHQV